MKNKSDSVATSARRDAAELRSIFGRNLRSLARNANSVSQLCRDLEINRTQFNRYLNGEAFPRPDVLAVICDHFKVDARILLTPLQDLTDRQGAANASDSVFVNDLLGAGIVSVDPDLFPDGFYLVHRTTETDPAVCMINLLKVYRTATGETYADGYILRAGARIIDLDMSPRRRTTSQVFQHPKGVSLFMVIPGTKFISVTYVQSGYGTSGRLYAGDNLFTQTLLARTSSTRRTIIQYLGKRAVDALAVRKYIGFVPMKSVSPAISTYLTMPQ